MPVLAVAGGTGGVGKTIVERLVQEGKFDVIVLSRSIPDKDTISQTVRYVQIDYNDIVSMTKELERHNVHTIISAVGLLSDEASKSQINLIDAAEKSSVTERFIPSEYSFIQTPDLLPVDPSIQWWLDAADRLKTSSLKYTRVIPGFFMDYWGMPNAKTNLSPYTFGIDISSGTAAIPGDGNDVICMTYTYDMATYLVKALDLDEWPEFSIIVGDQVTYNQLLAMAEEITDKKFIVSYDTLDQIQAGDVTVPPMPKGIEYPVDELKETTALVSRLTVNGVFDLPKENRLSDQFPNVRPITMKEFLEKAWRSQ
jgi:nucleoside-diphosphate-sugar epimerase